MLLDGKLVSKTVKEEVLKKVELLDNKPCLLVILVGNNEASKVYVASKEKACKKAGIISKTLILDEKVTQSELIKHIKKANKDKNIHAILVQLPLPKHFNEKEVINAIDPLKDVDGLHQINQGKLALNEKGIIPATPKGIMRIFSEYNIDLQGKKALVIGRSMLVGLPIALLMMHKNATVTIAHSKTKNLKQLCLDSEVIVVAMGKAKFITEDFVRENTVIIDVGINRIDEKIVGDVDYTSLVDKCLITPVPGGVGPTTIACLLENVLECYYLQNQ